MAKRTNRGAWGLAGVLAVLFEAVVMVSHGVKLGSFGAQAWWSTGGERDGYCSTTFVLSSATRRPTRAFHCYHLGHVRVEVITPPGLLCFR
jgi:hypothetical protein